MDRRGTEPRPFSMLQGHRWPIACDLFLLSLLLAVTVVFGRIADVDGWSSTRLLATTSSLAEDGDLDLRNDVLRSTLPASDVVRLAEPGQPTTAPVTSLSLGPSLLWLPAYLLARPITSDALPALERWDPLQRIALQALSLALLLLIVRFLAQLLHRLGASDHAAIGGAAALLLGTPLLIYGTASYTESPLASTAAACLFLLAALAFERSPTHHTAAAVGLATGCVFLCRWQDLVVVLLLLAPILTLRQRLGRGRLTALLGLAALTAAVPIAAQLALWLRETGSILPAAEAVSAGPGFALLLSPSGGVLFWAPLFVVGVVGLLRPWQCTLRSHWRGVLLLVIALQVGTTALLAVETRDATYGPHSLAVLLPLVAIGIGNLLARRRVPVAAIGALAACAAWGVVTASLFQRGITDLTAPLQTSQSAWWTLPIPSPVGLDWFALVGRTSPTHGTGSVLTLVGLLLLLALLLTALRHPPRRLPLSLAGSLLLLLTVGPGTAALRAAGFAEGTPLLGRQASQAGLEIDHTTRLVKAWQSVELGQAHRARALLRDLPDYPAVSELRARLPESWPALSASGVVTRINR